MFGLYKPTFKLAGKIGACNLADTIVIAGSPRSGTTLFQEALEAIPGYKALNEPLLTRSTRQQYGFDIRTFIEPGAAAPVQEDFLRMALTGGLGHRARWAFASETRLGKLYEHSTRRKLIVKFCRINRCLHWFIERFETRGVVLVVRHPCSVVSSMVRFGQWKRDFVASRYEPDSPLAIAHLPEQVREVFAPVVAGVRSQVEALATMWCLDYYIPFFLYSNHPWVLLSYERLVRDGEAELQRVGRALKVDVNDRMLGVLNRPSSSVKDAVGKDSTSQLSKWKRNLSGEQIDAILGIVDAVGLGAFFTDAIDPDYKALNRMQDPAYAWEDAALSPRAKTSMAQ